jgi:hypothetical protein
LHIPVKAAIGASQLDWTVDAYTGAAAFRRAATGEYSLIRHAGLVNMVAPASGTLLGYPKMAQLRGLDSFHTLALIVRPGERIHRSVDDWTYPMRVYLVHEQENAIMHDILTARYLDGDGFLPDGAVTAGRVKKRTCSSMYEPDRSGRPRASCRRRGRRTHWP